MSQPANPLIAERVDSTAWYSGVGIAETIDMIINGVENESWVDGALGGVGTIAETAVWVLDPVGALVTAGFGWCVEHVEPLSDALDWLAGDPDQVAASARSWHNVAVEHGDIADLYGRALRNQIPDWAGPAATAYHHQARETFDLLAGLGKAAEGMSVIVAMTGSLVTLVRTLVRDLIGELVSILVARLPIWTVEAVGTLGIGAPYVEAQVTALVAKWGARITRLLKALTTSLRNLMPAVRKLDEVVETIATLLRRRNTPGSAMTDTSAMSPIRWSGANYVDTPQSPRAAQLYDLIRATPDDTPRIAQNTGVGQDVIDQVKSHLFLTTHDVPVGPNVVVHGYFAPYDDVATLWTKATNGNLTPDELGQFKRLIGHEYVESRLMEAGLPYRTADPSLYSDGYPLPAPGMAHDLAPLPTTLRAPFAHWPALGLEPPDITLADDLSNLDEIVDAVLGVVQP